MQALSFIANFIGLSLVILASLSKGSKMSTILILVLFGNLFVSVGYLLAGTGINGAASGLLATVQTFINYFFERKGKPVPKILVGIYALSFIALNVFVSEFNFYSIIAILACMLFLACILQKNGKNFRICGILNTLVWIIYDVLTHSYAAIMTHGMLLIVNIIGVIIHDIKRNETKNSAM